jgi:hypothetical protein
MSKVDGFWLGDGEFVIDSCDRGRPKVAYRKNTRVFGWLFMLEAAGATAHFDVFYAFYGPSDSIGC